MATSNLRSVAAVAALSLLGCSSENAGGGELPGFAGSQAAPAAGAPAVLDSEPGVANFERPLGMPIGQNPAPEALQPSPSAGEPLPGGAAAGADLEIPVFSPPEAVAPCSGCVELNVDVDDINQRDNFVYAPGDVSVTRVVWTILVPFNSDQLFVQPFVDNIYGTFTDLDANAFALNTPVEVIQEYSGPAGTVGLAVGSSGAWTGNMTMSIFVDAVTLEGAEPSASRTFDLDIEGLVVGSNANNPRIVYHP